MPVRTLELSSKQVADCLGVCPTAASRKVELAEEFLLVALNAGQLTGKRADRKNRSLGCRIRIISRLETAHPDKFRLWLEGLSRRCPRSPGR